MATQVSVVRPGQLTLRDTAFVVCGPDADGGAGFTGFGLNELGLRFGSTAAAASLLAACEAIVGESGHGHDGPPLGAPEDDSHPPHGPPPGSLTSLGGSAAPMLVTPGVTPNRTPNATPARPTCNGGGAAAGHGHPLTQQRAGSGGGGGGGQPPSAGPSTFHTANSSATPHSGAAYHTAQSSAARASPPRCASGAAASNGAGGGSSAPRSAFDAPSASDQRLQQAEQEILRLSALLAERDMEAGRLLKRLEQAQLAVRARDAKVAELQRRLNLLSAK